MQSRDRLIFSHHTKLYFCLDFAGCDKRLRRRAKQANPLLAQAVGLAHAEFGPNDRHSVRAELL